MKYLPSRLPLPSSPPIPPLLRSPPILPPSLRVPQDTVVLFDSLREVQDPVPVDPARERIMYV